MNKYLKISVQTTLLVCISMLSTWRSVAQNSLYTGQAPIGIPLYTVSDGKTQIPIGLNYNASGIKPNEHPGWVGQNWNLQAGGFVARKVNGVPDDMKADFQVPQLGGKKITVQGLYYRLAEVLAPGYFNYEVAGNNWDNPGTSNSTLKSSYDRYMQIDKNDTEPDEFFFSLPDGRSGTFLLDSTKNLLDPSKNWILKGNKTFKVKLLGLANVPFSTWKSVYTRNPSTYSPNAALGYDCIKDNNTNICSRLVIEFSKTFSGFVVTDDSGTEYTFGGDSTSIQYSIPLYQQYHAHWKADAWFLTKIKPLGGTETTLKYEEFSEKFNGKNIGGKFQVSMTSILQQAQFCIVPNQNCNASYVSLAADVDSIKLYTGELTRPTYLKKIETVRDSVVFYKSRSVEMEYSKNIFRSNYLYWKQKITFFQKTIPDPPYFPLPLEENKPAPAWLPNTLNENWNTTDSLDKYLNDIGWAKLDRIKVFSKVAGENHAEIEYLFKYNNSNKSYTYQSVGNKITRTGGFNERIRLDTVAQVALGKSLVYKMDYYKNDTIPLPRYLDKDGLVDHWGYLNRKKRKPQFYYYGSDYFKQRNSTKFLEVARIGTIKSITFPTGGKSIYEFEQNTYSKIYDYGIHFIKNGVYVDTAFIRKRADTLIYFGTDFINNPKRDYRTLASNRFSYNYLLGTGTEYSARGFFVDSVRTDTVGGLRIKKITSLDADGKFIGNKSYIYQENYKKPKNLISSGILNYRYSYSLRRNGVGKNWYGNKYIIDAQNANYDSETSGYYEAAGYTTLFNAIGYMNQPPVTYNEVTEVSYDGSYRKYHFSNYYSKIAGEHLDELIVNGYNSNNYRKIAEYTDYEPFVDKSFERGRIYMVESYRSDDKIVGLQKMTYKALLTGRSDYVKSLALNSSFITTSTATSFNFFNALVSIAVEVGLGFLTAGQHWTVKAFITAANPTATLLPIMSQSTYMHFNESAYPRKIYTYNYEMVTDSTWTFDYNDQTKKIFSTNTYKYNGFGQLRELKRIQNDGLELLTNNKYISDYDFKALINNADYSSCTSTALTCQQGCINSYPNQDDAAICQAQCGDQEAVCRQNIATNFISNPTSKNLYKMQMKNMVGHPVESIVKRKNINTSTYKVLGGTLNFYGEFNANGTLMYAPQSILKMKQTQTNATADTSKLDASGAFVYDQTRYTVKTFETTPSDGYGAFGNLTKYVGRDGVSNTMTHNAMNYPISKNIGITYGGNEFYSTMEYAPILGMVKTADQNNRKIRNRYDEFNRLRSVSKTLSESGTDNDYLLKLYNYHYFNDNSDITISDFVVGGCNGDSPASCTLRATLVPNSFMEMKVGSGLATTITGSFEEGINTVIDPAKYTWTNPAGTLTTAAAFTIPALTTVNLNSVLGTYYYKVEKGGCQSCLKFTISKKTTATDPDLLAEEDK